MTFTVNQPVEYFESLFEWLPGAAFVINAQGGFLKTNSAFTALLGYGPDEIESLRFADIAATLGPDSAVKPSLREQILRFALYPMELAEKRPAPCTLIAKSGERIPVILKSHIVRDNAGSIMQAIGTASPERRPVTENETQQERRFRQAWESEELYRNILENSGDAVIIADLNGWIATTNDAAIRMFGFERQEEVLGRYLLEFLPVTGSYASSTGETFVVTEEYYSQQIKHIEELFETGMAKTRGYMFKKDQSVFPIEATMSLLRDQQGKQRGTITICRDVTDTLVAERTIAQSQSFLNNIFETIGDGLFVTDSSGNIKMVNRTFCEIVGYDEQELLETAAYDLFQADTNPETATPAGMQSFANSTPKRHESVCRRKDGSTVHVELKITMFSDLSGEAAVITLRDITERKKFEEQLCKAHNELEHTVQDRTQDLQEANTALRVLLNTRDDERQTLEKKIMSRVHELAMPYIEKLQAISHSERQQVLLDTLAVNLRNIIAPFECSKAPPHLQFTPMETQVASLVQYGRTTKEIAEVLSLSTKTVAFHRDSIRRKLGIHNKKISLRKHLLSCSSQTARPAG